MSDERVEQQSEPGYEPPRVEVIGSVEELTLGMKVSGSTDNVQYSPSLTT